MRILIIALFTVSTAFAKISVSVSIIPQAFFVQKIAGNLVEVNVMVQKGKSPETYEPTIKELEKLSESQIYFNIGMPFESAWLKRFEGVNPNLKIVAPLKKGELEAYLAQYEDLADSHFHKDDEHHANDSQESHKASGNPHNSHSKHNHVELQEIHRHYPHIWLSFILSKAHAQVICDNLCEIDTKNCAIYKKNLVRLEKEIDKMFAHFKAVFGGTGGAFLVYHPAFSYIANELGLQEFAIEKDGKEGKIAHTKEILAIIKAKNIKAIFIQPQFSSKSAKVLAKEAKISIKTADPLAFDWLENIHTFLSELEKLK